MLINILIQNLTLFHEFISTKYQYQIIHNNICLYSLKILQTSTLN